MADMTDITALSIERRFVRARNAAPAATAAWITLTAIALVVVGGVADPTSLIGGTAALFYVGPGLVVLGRRNWHVVGWLLLLTGLALAATFAGAPIYLAGYARWADPAWYAWVFDNWTYAAAFACVVALITMFPDGLRGRPTGLRLLGKTTLTASGVMVVLAMLIRQVGGESVPDLLPNPTGLGFLPQSIGDVVAAIAIVLVAVSLLGFWLRHRHTTGVERAQYRWVGYSFALVITGLVTGLVAGIWLDPASGVQWLLVLAAFYLVPVAFSLAILRFGLYEIDRIVSRTVTYGVVAPVVAVVYAVPVVALPRLLGESNDLVIAGSTLAAAAVFNPARRRIQRVVDHRFNRSRFDAEHQLEVFGSTLRADVDLGSIERDLYEVMTTTIAPERMAMWIR